MTSLRERAIELWRAGALLPLLWGLGATAVLCGIHWFSGLIVPENTWNLQWTSVDDLRVSAVRASTDSTARVRWGITTAALWCAACSGIAVSLWAASSTLGPSARARLFPAAWCVVLCLFVLGLRLDLAGAFMGDDVSKHLFDHVHLRHGSLGAITRYGNALVFTGAVCVALGFVAILSREHAESIPRFRHRLFAMRALLYSGAAILATGALEVLSLYSWPASLIACEAQAAAFRGIGTALAGATGGAGTILLASLYLPTAIQMGTRIRALAEEALPHRTKAQQDEWLASEGLQSNWGAQVREAFAIAAPLLAGSGVSSLLSSLVE